MSISVENINKFYGKQHVLNNLSFEVGRGEVVGFLGPNGAGKSTTMKILCGFISTTSGKAFIDGDDVEKNSMQARRNIGYLPESNPLYGDMYVREYMQMCGRIYGVRKNLKSRIDEVLELTGLTPEAHKKAGQLSKGYKQRLGLSAAILHNPKVLILDEPTTGLDPNQIVDIRNLIRDIGKEKTVILSTHIMQEVEAVCSRAIIINKGKIVADKAIDEFKTASNIGKQRVEVEFLQNADNNILEEIAFGKIVETYNAQHFLIENTINEDIRPLLFNIAASKGLTIITLREKEQHLEEVFRIITKKN